MRVLSPYVPKPQMPSVTDIFIPNQCKLWPWLAVVWMNVALKTPGVVGTHQPDLSVKPLKEVWRNILIRKRWSH